MTAAPAPAVFVSYSHADRRVARCLVRRLSAHGIKVWIDERGLRVGAALTSSLRRQIEHADMVLVVASQAAAASKWVGLELAHAREHDKTVVPLFIEPVAHDERFVDTLGVDATLPQAFADAIDRIMRDLYLSFDAELPPADPAALEAGLRALAKEEPALAPLIHGCLDSEGLHRESMETVHGSAFHPLDDALNSLFDLKPNETMACHAAYGFCSAGAGAKALFSWIAMTGDGGLPLVTAVGREGLQAGLMATAFRLLEACDPPNNHALYNFIHHNAARWDPDQRRQAIRLVTWPVRKDTSRLGDVLGAVALEHFPDAVEVQQMWSRWIREGVFDGTPSTPTDLARYLASAHKENLRGWESVDDALRDHVRGCLRSGDRSRVDVAADHIQAAADAGAPVLGALLREAHGVSGTAEWNGWKERDPDTATLMGWYVFEVAREAVEGRDWSRALEGAQRMAALEKRRMGLLAASKRSGKDSP